MELNRKTEIRILHIEDPNNFWFCTKKSERKLIAYIKEYLTFGDGPVFVPNEIVAVKTNGSFKIAKVLKVNEKSNSLMCLLNGIKHNGVKKHCREFPCDVAIPLGNGLPVDQLIDVIIRGSIIGVAPAEMVCLVLNYIIGKIISV